MSLNAIIKPTGHFKMTRINASTMKVVEELEFDNLITDIGIHRMGLDSTYSYTAPHGGWLTPILYVGSGNTTPAVTDTAMAGQIAWTSTIQSATGTPIITGNGGQQWVVTYRFAMGAAAGTLAEVGTGWGHPSSVNSLFSRALIRDMSGNPTTLTILPDEILDVTYTLTINYPAESSGTITLNGQVHSWVMRPARVGDIVSTYSTNSPRGTHNSSQSGPGYTSNAATYAINNIQAFAGDAVLGPVTSSPTGTSLGMLSSSFVNIVGVYNSTTRSKQYSIGADLNFWNHASGIGAIAFNITSSNTSMSNSFISTQGLAKFQISFDPPIPKTASQRLRLDFNLTFSNT